MYGSGGTPNARPRSAGGYPLKRAAYSRYRGRERRCLLGGVGEEGTLLMRLGNHEYRTRQEVWE